MDCHDARPVSKGIVEFACHLLFFVALQQENEPAGKDLRDL